MLTRVKTPKEITQMRVGGKMLASVLAMLRSNLEIGMSTKDLANLAAKELKALGGKPAFLGYQGYPDVLCVSLNNEVVHGIPSTKKFIQKGDIVSLDFGVLYGGLITDAAISVVVPRSPYSARSEPRPAASASSSSRRPMGDGGLAGDPGNGAAHRLVTNTERALSAGIEAVTGITAVGTIAAAVQAVLDKNRYGIVRDLVGHGVGHDLHEDPNIPNHGKPGTGFRLQPGMTVAIEPMATLGGYEVIIAEDGWTVLTRDGSLAAHFEHTILITEQGFEILTTL